MLQKHHCGIKWKFIISILAEPFSFPLYMNCFEQPYVYIFSFSHHCPLIVYVCLSCLHLDLARPDCHTLTIAHRGIGDILAGSVLFPPHHHIGLSTRFLFDRFSFRSCFQLLTLHALAVVFCFLCDSLLCCFSGFRGLTL